MPMIVADVVNAIFRSLVAVVNALVSILPDSPFSGFIDTMQSSIGSELLGYVNYFLPISEFVSILSLWLSGVLLYYVVSVILRWVKAVS